MIECKRCGQCCHLIADNGKGEWVQTNIPCKFLVFQKNGRTRCKIYKRKDRIGTVIGITNIVNVCSKRAYSAFDFVGCPYNTNKIIKDVKTWQKEKHYLEV